MEMISVQRIDTLGHNAEIKTESGFVTRISLNFGTGHFLRGAGWLAAKSDSAAAKAQFAVLYIGARESDGRPGAKRGPMSR